MTAVSPPWPPQFAAINWKLKANTAVFQSPLTGSMQVSARPGDQWQCEIKFPPMARADHDDWSAWVTKALSRSEAVALNDYKNSRPRNYTSGIDGALTCDSTSVKCDSTAYKADAGFSYGAPYVNGADQTGRSLVTGGWNASATLYAGTWLAFDNGTYVELHKIEATVAADSSGAATIDIVPPIRRSPSNATEIRVDGQCTALSHRCYGEFLLSPGDTVSWSTDAGMEQLDSVTAIEFLR
jgi:hypothetical protein